MKKKFDTSGKFGDISKQTTSDKAKQGSKIDELKVVTKEILSVSDIANSAEKNTDQHSANSAEKITDQHSAKTAAEAENQNNTYTPTVSHAESLTPIMSEENAVIDMQFSQDNTSPTANQLDETPESAPKVKAKKRYFNTTRSAYEKIVAYFGKLKPMEHKQRAATIGVSLWHGTKKLSKRWFIEAFTGMAQGLFVTLIAGTIIKQFGVWIGETTTFGKFLVTAGTIASFLMGAGIGAGIASHLKAPKLVIFSCMVAGMIGAFSGKLLDGSWINNGLAAMVPGNPISSYICALVACEIGKFISGKTKLDILLVPLSVIIVAIGATYLCIPFVKLVDLISKGINIATSAQPALMGIIIAVVVGVLLTMPTSSAAICIALGLGGIAGGAAVVGCACQMVGFAVQSFRENKFSGLISQGLGTSMLQIPNIFKKPIIIVPPIIASAIAGPLATSVFMLQCSPAGSGMGTCGFVGLITTVEASLKAGLPAWKLGLGITLLFFVIPIVVCLVVSELMRKFNLIKFGDMALDYDN